MWQCMKEHYLKRIIIFPAVLLCIVILPGCVSVVKEKERLRDLDYIIVEELDIPGELKDMIEKNKNSPFGLTYSDNGELYIVRGYGRREKTGYEVEAVNLYETGQSVCFHTALIGPQKGEDTEEIPTFPYIVVKLKDLGKNVIFE